MSIPTIREVVSRPTVVKAAPPDCSGVHESCVRAHLILRVVVSLLHRGAQPDLILGVISLYDEAGETRYAEE